jgi:hypothetical protein
MRAAPNLHNQFDLPNGFTRRLRVTGYRFLQATTIIGCLLVAVPLRAEAPPGSEIAIRLYDTFGVPKNDIRTAQDVAGEILEAAGVQARWRECWKDVGVARGAMRLCDDTLKPTEVIVRIVTDRSDHHNNLMALGYSLVVAKSGAATLATVFGNRVTHVAQRLHFDRAILLGRAIAHEVGHLLLGTSDHGTDGLMRAHWSDAALRGHDDGWRFSPQEADRIKAELWARNVPKTDVLTTYASVDANVVRLAGTK